MKRAISGTTDVNNTGEKLQTALRVLVTALFAACVLFIWHNSMENAEVSAGRSGRVTNLVNQVLECVGGETVTEHFVRKLAHFSEYGLEGVLTVFLFMAYSLKPVRHLRWMALTGFLTAAVDESIQFFSAGRAPGVLDVCIDMAGFICGVLSVSALCGILHCVINRRSLTGICRLPEEQAHSSR